MEYLHGLRGIIMLRGNFTNLDSKDLKEKVYTRDLFSVD